MTATRKGKPSVVSIEALLVSDDHEGLRKAVTALTGHGAYEIGAHAVDGFALPEGEGQEVPRIGTMARDRRSCIHSFSCRCTGRIRFYEPPRPRRQVGS